jgi:rhodanese-related sulfurtransferase
MRVVEYEQFIEFKRHNSATIINVLPAEYFEKTRIPGSINIPYENANFANEVEYVIGGKNLPLIVYCASETCDASKKAATKLDEVGFTDVMCYEGGAKEWNEKMPQAA